MPVGLVKYMEVIDGFSVTVVHTLAKRQLEEKGFIWLTLPKSQSLIEGGLDRSSGRD